MPLDKEHPLAAVEIIRRELEKGVEESPLEVAPFIGNARRIERALCEAGHLRSGEEILDLLEEAGTDGG